MTLLKKLVFIFFNIICFSINIIAQKSDVLIRPILVTTVTVKDQKIYEPIEALGNLKANENVEITSSVTEKIDKILFKSGQEVKTGEILVQLNNAFEKAELKSAEAEMLKAKLAYDRANSLQKTKAVSKATLQERLANFEKAQANVTEINAKLDDLKIVAPFSGVLGIKKLSPGALVKPGDVIITLTDIDKIKVSFDVPSIYLSDLKIGEKIYGTVDAYKEKTFVGNIYAIENSVDPVTRTIELRAIVPNKDHLLKPGLLMNVLLKNNQRTVPVIPEEAVIKEGKDDYVYLVINKQKNNYAKKTKVVLGDRESGNVEIIEGVKSGDVIVSHGNFKLKDDSLIQIKENSN